MNVYFLFFQKIKILSQKFIQKIFNKRSIYKYSQHIIWLIFVFCVYACVLVPPAWWGGFGFVTWLIPVVIFFNVLFFSKYFYQYFTKKITPNPNKPRKIYLIPFYFWLCLVALPFWDATWGGWKGWRNDILEGKIKIQTSEKEEFFTEKDFTNNKNSQKNNPFEVISYNVRVFNAYEHLRNQNPKASAQMLNWLAEHPAEIKCLQEFYHLECSKEFHTIDILTQTPTQKYNYFVRSEQELREKNGFFGTIILTKFPIVKGGNVFEGRLPHQTPIFADILLTKKDTLRVINAHLQSMSIDEKDTKNTIFQKIWRAFSPRTNQIHLLEEFIKKSPYPVLLCTDLNDLPYSYAYYRLKSYLQNSFEMRGNGLGATFNSLLPIVRIDHHFFDANKYDCQKFAVVDSLDSSDHFPVWGKYKIRNDK